MVLLRAFRDRVKPMKGVKESLFITCPSYEDRSIAIIQRFSEDYNAEHAVFFLSKEYAKKGKTPEHLKLAEDAVRRVCHSEPQVIEFSMDQPIPPMSKFEDLCRTWHKSSPIESITVDVSTFPRQELLVLLRVLDSFPNHPSIRLFYTEPEKYGTEETGGWLTRGVRSVRTVPGFGGVQPPGKKKLLIMFLGHEDERAAITWKRHQPGMTIAIIPDPKYRKELNGIVERTHQLFFTKLTNAQLHTPVPARGIVEAQDAILSLWEKHHCSSFLVVAPLGTKLQTLGIYMAAKLKSDIQITYAIPSVYNFKNYSHGIGRIWEASWNRR